MIEKKENVVVKTAMKRKWSLLLTVPVSYTHLTLPTIYSV